MFPHAAALGASTAWNTYPLFAGLPFSLAQERQRLRTMAIGDLPADHRWVWDEAQVRSPPGLVFCRFFLSLVQERIPAPRFIFGAVFFLIWGCHSMFQVCRLFWEFFFCSAGHYV